MAKTLGEGRLAHALLLIGPSGSGKRVFARALAGAIVCRQRQPDGSACGNCPSCRMLAAGSHPDVFRLEKEEDSKVLKVGDLRKFNRRLFLTAQVGNGRVGLIDPVQELNRNSANALLKSLEEPPVGAHLMLIGERWHSLPATVRSRCQIVRFALPAASEARKWLEQQRADDPELTALRRRHAADDAAAQEWLAAFTRLCTGESDPVGLAQRWEKLDERLPHLLEQMHQWTRELLRLKAGGGLNSGPPLPPGLRARAMSASGTELHRLAVLVVETRAMLESQAKPQLLLENLLASWYQTLTTSTGHKAASR